MNYPIIYLAFANEPEGESRFLTQLQEEKETLKGLYDQYFFDKPFGYRVSYEGSPEELIWDINRFSQRISIFHFSGHGNIDGLQLEHPSKFKTFLPKQNLGKILSNEVLGRLKLVFLNACATWGHLKVLRELDVPAIMVTHSSIEDYAATKFSILFYQGILAEIPLEDAFQRARIAIGEQETNSRVYRGFELESYVASEMDVPWGLYVRDEKILKWRIQSEFHSLNFIQTEFLSPLPLKPKIFVGREEELIAVTKKLYQSKRAVLLSGIGGIGKTSIASAYAYENRVAYANILWVSVLTDPNNEQTRHRNFSYEIAHDIELFDKLQISFDPKEKIPKRLEKVCKKLSQLEGLNLLVIDNAGYDLEKVSHLLPHSSNWHILITSRHKLEPFVEVEVNEMIPQKVEKVFHSFYPRKEGETLYVQELLGYIGYHTLTTELIAKLCRSNPDHSPQTVLEFLKEQNLEEITPKIWSDYSRKRDLILLQLFHTFSLFELDFRELNLLTHLSVLPSRELPMADLEALFGNDFLTPEVLEEVSENLLRKGWIKYDGIAKLIGIHQLVQEVLRYKLKPNPDTTTQLVKTLGSLLSINSGVKNPIDTFKWIRYGDTYSTYVRGSSSDVTKLKNNLALRFGEAGNLSRSKQLLIEALDEDLQLLPKDHPTVNKRRLNLGMVYIKMGKFKDAKKLIQEAINGDESRFGPKDPRVLNGKNILGNLLYETGLYQEADQLFTNLLSTYQANEGSSPLKIADMKNNLAATAQELGNYDKSLKLFLEVYRIYEKQFKEGHPKLFDTMSNIAAVWRHLGKYDKAEEYYRKALDGFISLFGESHPNVSQTESNLATIYRAQNRWEEAEKLLLKALEFELSYFGESHPKIATRRSNLGLVYRESGQLLKAKELFEQALGYHMTKFGPKHVKTAHILSLLATVLDRLGEPHTAKGYLERAIEIETKVYGKDHATLGTRYNALGNVYESLGDRKSAVEYTRKAYEIYEKTLGVNHPWTLIAQRNLKLKEGK